MRINLSIDCRLLATTMQGDTGLTYADLADLPDEEFQNRYREWLSKILFHTYIYAVNRPDVVTHYRSGQTGKPLITAKAVKHKGD